MGEQSNAYRILLRYDRKSRHRRIKKQRRYERLAATSQFRCYPGYQELWLPSVTSRACAGLVGDRTFSGGRSPYLKPTITLVDPYLTERWTAQLCRSKHCREPSQLRIVSIPWIITRLSLTDCTREVLPTQLLGTKNLTRVSRIQVCCPSRRTISLVN